MDRRGPPSDASPRGPAGPPSRPAAERGWRRLGLRLAAGLVAGSLLLALSAVPYRILLASAATAVVRATEPRPATRLSYHSEDAAFLVDRSDFRSGSPRPLVPALDITANLV